MSTIEDDVMVKEIETIAGPSYGHTNTINETTNEAQSSFINSLHLDDPAKQWAELKALVANTPETDHINIQFIKDELSSGSYQIDSEKIAAKLINFTCLIEHAEMS